MKKDELIDMWQNGSERMFRDEKTDKKMIAQYLNEKTLKGSRSISFNLIFYGLIQLANIILLSMNLSGYANNSTMVWILIPQLLITIGILIFGIDLYYKLKDINNYSESLQVLIEKQLWFFRKPYEIWLFLASVSAIILISNVNLYVDNDNGSYVINNKLMFVTVTIAAFLFIYGSQKVASIRGYKALKAYLHDLQQGALDKSDQMERTKKRYLWLWIIVFALLTASLVFGIINAAKL
jgi:heme/copper-type cytochrome/quinol oxidase subunit 2